MRLRDFDVMGVARGSAADQAGLSDDKFQMRAVALASVFGLRSPSLASVSDRLHWPASRTMAPVSTQSRSGLVELKLGREAASLAAHLK